MRDDPDTGSAVWLRPPSQTREAAPVVYYGERRPPDPVPVVYYYSDSFPKNDGLLLRSFHPAEELGEKERVSRSTLLPANDILILVVLLLILRWAIQRYLQHWKKKPGAFVQEETCQAPVPPVLAQKDLVIGSDRPDTSAHGRDHRKETQELRHRQRVGGGVSVAVPPTAVQRARAVSDSNCGRPLAEEKNHDVSTPGNKRKHEQCEQQLLSDNEALKRCKQEFIEEDHAGFQQMMSAVKVAVQCGICSDTMKHASTVSGCGHTFCRSCIEEVLRVKGCCPCKVPAWQRDIKDARRLKGVMEVSGIEQSGGC